MKVDLAGKLGESLAREEAWITQEDARLRIEEDAHRAERKAIGASLSEAHAMKAPKEGGAGMEMHPELSDTERRLSDARRESERLSRELGRAEGALEANTVTVEQIVAVPHVRT